MLFVKVFANYFQDEATLKMELLKICPVNESLNIKHIKAGIFMLDVADPELGDFLVLHPPWCFKGLCMGIRKWQEGVRPQDLDFSKENFWIQVLNLPLECINDRIGTDLGRSIGHVFETDEEVFYGDMWLFMRIRIELKTREPLPLGIKVRNRFGEQELLLIKIENLGLFCFKCGRLGHNGFNCSLGPAFNPRLVNNRKRKYSMSLKGITPRAKVPIYTRAVPYKSPDKSERVPERSTEACDKASLKVHTVADEEHILVTNKHTVEEKTKGFDVDKTSSAKVLDPLFLSNQFKEGVFYFNASSDKPHSQGPPFICSSSLNSSPFASRNPSPFCFKFVATKNQSQSNFTSFRSLRHKSLKPKFLKSSAPSLQSFQGHPSPSSTPDVLPFFSSPVADEVNSAGSDEDENYLVDDFYTLGEASNKRVRLTALSLRRNNCYFLQPKPKKFKSIHAFHLVLSDGSSMQISVNDSSSASSISEEASCSVSGCGISSDGYQV